MGASKIDSAARSGAMALWVAKSKWARHEMAPVDAGPGPINFLLLKIFETK